MRGQQRHRALAAPGQEVKEEPQRLDQRFRPAVVGRHQQHRPPQRAAQQRRDEYFGGVGQSCQRQLAAGRTSRRSLPYALLQFPHHRGEAGVLLQPPDGLLDKGNNHCRPAILSISSLVE